MLFFTTGTVNTLKKIETFAFFVRKRYKITNLRRIKQDETRDYSQYRHHKIESIESAGEKKSMNDVVAKSNQNNKTNTLKTSSSKR